MAAITEVGALSQKLGFDPGYLEDFEDKVFIEGPKARRRLVNFFSPVVMSVELPQLKF